MDSVRNESNQVRFETNQTRFGSKLIQTKLKPKVSSVRFGSVRCHPYTYEVKISLSYFFITLMISKLIKFEDLTFAFFFQ